MENKKIEALMGKLKSVLISDTANCFVVASESRKEKNKDVCFISGDIDNICDMVGVVSLKQLCSKGNEDIISIILGASKIILRAYPQLDKILKFDNEYYILEYSEKQNQFHYNLCDIPENTNEYKTLGVLEQRLCPVFTEYIRKFKVKEDYDSIFFEFTKFKYLMGESNF